MARPNSPWYVPRRDAWVAKVGGRQYTLAKGRKNRREAERALHRLLEARDSGRAVVGPKDVGLTALFDGFMESRKANGVKPLTSSFYRRYLASFLSFAGRSRGAATVTPEMVSTWLSLPRSVRRRRKRSEGGGFKTVELPPWGPSTRHGAIVALKAAFAWGVRRKWLAESPIREMKGPGIRQRKSVLDEGAVRRIIDAARGPFREILEFLWETGCRPSEAMSLEGGHIDFPGGVATMEGKTTNKTGELRTIYLTDRARGILLAAVAAHPAGPVFRSARGNPWQRHAMAQRFARLREKLGMGGEATAEAFRHAFGTDGALRLKPLALAELLGHTSAAMVTKYYSHLDERREEMKAALGDVRPPKGDRPRSE